MLFGSEKSGGERVHGRKEVNNGIWGLCFHRGGRFVCVVAPFSFGAEGGDRGEGRGRGKVKTHLQIKFKEVESSKVRYFKRSQLQKPICQGQALFY